MDNEKKPCCCCGTPAQPEAATAPAVDASAVPTESVTPSCCRHKDRTPAGGSSVLFGRLGGAAGLFFSISHSR